MKNKFKYICTSKTASMYFDLTYYYYYYCYYYYYYYYYYTKLTFFSGWAHKKAERIDLKKLTIFV